MTTSLRLACIGQTYIQVLLIWIGVFVFQQNAKGQEAREAFCPTGPTVKLDTIVFVPDKPLPFDRCFFLVVTQSATSTVDRFALTPLGKQGQNNFTIRDRNILLRSTYPDKKEREDAKNKTPVAILNEGPFGKPIKITKKVIKGNKVDLYLHITPLDPGREYKITLIGRDDTAFDEVVNISSTIIESKQASAVGQTVVAGNLLDQAKRANAASIANAKIRNPVRFSRGDIADYERRIAQFTLNFDLGTLLPSGTKKPDGYKLFFVPDGKPLLDLNSAGTNSNGSSFSGKKIPQLFLINLPREDTDGNEIEPFKEGKYCLQLLATYDTPKNIFAKIFNKLAGKKKRTPKNFLIDLGKLELLADPAFAYKFAPDLQTSTDVFVELDKYNPLALLSTIKSTSITIIQLPTSLTASCLDTTQATLGFLLTQASLCPCVEKGIKDLTQKDDLMRTISLLYDKDPTVLGNSLSGRKSLKAPAAKAADPENYQARSDNLSISISLLDDLIEFARKEEAYHSADAVKIKHLLGCLQSLRSQMVTAKGALDAQVKARAKLQDEFTVRFGLLTTESIAQGSTSVFNFLSEAKFQISPDFGFVALFKGNKVYTFQDFTPYLGFQVGFRPIDKNIPFRLIHHKSLWHRLSFMSGVTLTSLKIDNQRQDFFDKYSLITGLGFRMGNYLRATTGLVWFKAVDPNQLSANKPARFSPFVGLSVDFELQDLFGGIAKLFK